MRQRLRQLQERLGWGDLLREPAPRADRGSVRYLVLDALKGAPHHGYEVLKVIGEKSGDAYRPSPGVIYPTLQMLEELGLVELTSRDGRKIYAITAEGRAELASHAVEVREFYESSSDQGFDRHGGELRQLAQRLGRLLHLGKRSFKRGRLRPTQARRVRAILDGAIDQLEKVLEEEP